MKLYPIPGAPGLSAGVDLDTLVAIQKSAQAAGRLWSVKGIIGHLGDRDAAMIAAVARHGVRNPDGTAYQGDVSALGVPLVALSDALAAAIVFLVVGDEPQPEATADA